METVGSKQGQIWLFCSHCGERYDAGSGLAACPRDDATLIHMLEDPLVGTKLDSRYEILELIGVGAWSRVYKARQIALGRLVSVKVLQPQLAIDDRKWKRFEQEAKVSSSIKHPNIVNVFDFGLHPQPFIVMEYLEGVTLAHRVKRYGPVPVQQALGLFTEICDALQAAHEKGLIHRDLKPANVMLTESSEGKTVAKVLDLGLAKLVDSDDQTIVKLTTTGQVLGSPAYMSPEQCTEGKLDARSDIYSLGCLIYEALTGKRAFDADNSAECMRKHLLELPPGMNSIDSSLQIPEPLEGIVFRALAVEPIERYQTVADVKKDLLSVAEGKTEGLLYTRKEWGARLSQLRRYLQQPKVQITCSSIALLVLSTFIFFFNREAIVNAAWQYQYDQGKQLLNQQSYDKAEPKLKSALYLTSWFGADDWRTGRSLVQLRNLYKAKHESSLAQELNSRIVVLEKGSQKWTAELQSAEKKQKEGHYAQSESILTNIIAQQRLSPQDRLALSFSLIKLGDAYKLAGKLPNSETAYRESLSIREKYLDRDDPLLTESIEQLAEICLFQGRYSEARELLEEVLTLKKRALGAFDPEVAVILGRLADAYWGQNQFSTAEQFYKEALSIMDKAGKSNDTRTAPISGGLARLYTQAQKYEKAEPLALRSLSIQKKEYGDGNLMTCPALTVLGNLRFAQGRLDEATACMKEAYDIYINKLGETNQGTLTSLENLIRVVRSKNPELATKLEQQSESIRARLTSASTNR